MPSLLEQLTSETEGEQLTATFGASVSTFGQRRLSIVELLRDLILLESEVLKDALRPAYGHVYKLYQAFPHNSFLAGVMESMFTYLFQNALSQQPNGVGISDLSGYRQKVLEELDLLTKLSE